MHSKLPTDTRNTNLDSCLLCLRQGLSVLEKAYTQWAEWQHHTYQQVIALVAALLLLALLSEGSACTVQQPCAALFGTAAANGLFYGLSKLDMISITAYACTSAFALVGSALFQGACQASPLDARRHMADLCSAYLAMADL